jgi:tetratricopeptide (TPR) repeat protein
MRDAGRFADAFDVLDKALERQPNSPELLYDHGMAAEKIDRLPVMESSLRKLIQLRPDHAHAYNALGYTFAERNIRLDEAKELLDRTRAAARPRRRAYPGQHGLADVSARRARKAARVPARAYALRPEAEIAAHLGEVLWAMGRTEEARTCGRRRQPRAEQRDLGNTRPAHMCALIHGGPKPASLRGRRVPRLRRRPARRMRNACARHDVPGLLTAARLAPLPLAASWMTGRSAGVRPSENNPQRASGNSCCGSTGPAQRTRSRPRHWARPWRWPVWRLARPLW